jgi:DNA primase
VNSETGCWKCFSACGRGGSLVDFEMTLTGSDFKAALATICSIIGRPMPERARMTHEEWHALQGAREREEQEHKESQYFSDAALILSEYALASLDSHAEERAIYTLLIDDVRKDSRALYRDCQKRHPEIVGALVGAGHRIDRRQQMWLLNFIESMAAEDSQDAA